MARGRKTIFHNRFSKEDERPPAGHIHLWCSAQLLMCVCDATTDAKYINQIITSSDIFMIDCELDFRILL
jgi:hypothetical protein